MITRCKHGLIKGQCSYCLRFGDSEYPEKDQTMRDKPDPTKAKQAKK